MPVFLDTETTGLSPSSGDKIVEIAIVDGSGRILLNSLVDPGRAIPWHATNVHGITDSMVRGRPTLTQLMPQIREIISNQVVVIYNSSFDTPFFPGKLKEAGSVECAMRRFTQTSGGGRWKKLDVAARQCGHRWTGSAHRALADALACRSVWQWLEASATKSSIGNRQTSGSLESKPTTTLRCANGCSPLLRVPSGKLLDITCPTCKQTFRRQT